MKNFEVTRTFCLAIAFSLAALVTQSQAQITGAITPDPYTVGETLTVNTEGKIPANGVGTFVLICKWDSILSLDPDGGTVDSSPASTVIAEKTVTGTTPQSEKTLSGSDTTKAPDLPFYGCKIVLARKVATGNKKKPFRFIPIRPTGNFEAERKKKKENDGDLEPLPNESPTFKNPAP